MFGPIGFAEIAFILILALLIFGPRRLPEMARTLGKGIGEFRRMSDDVRRTINAEIALDDDEQRPSIARRPESPAAPITEGHKIEAPRDSRSRRDQDTGPPPGRTVLGSAAGAAAAETGTEETGASESPIDGEPETGGGEAGLELGAEEQPLIRPAQGAVPSLRGGRRRAGSRGGSSAEAAEGEPSATESSAAESAGGSSASAANEAADEV
ncbi:MAG: twin-arginine translocase TatA/TatE family subunit [Acidobacteriota bacterium]